MIFLFLFSGAVKAEAEIKNIDIYMLRGGNGVTGTRKSVPALGHLFFIASLPGGYCGW